jgi:hypothetical protein
MTLYVATQNVMLDCGFGPQPVFEFVRSGLDVPKHVMDSTRIIYICILSSEFFNVSRY